MAKRRRGASEEDILLLLLFLFGAMAVVGAMAVSVVAAVLDVATEPTSTATATPVADGETPTATVTVTRTPTATPVADGAVATPTPALGLPDLVVTTLETTGPTSVNEEGGVDVPIRVIVKNQGAVAAGIFKVAIEYSGPTIDPATGEIDDESTTVVPFTVPGQNGIRYPYTSGPLPAGESVPFEGTVAFEAVVFDLVEELALGGLSLKATADSCSGDEFMPAYCRVEESDEGNNGFTALLVPLPTPTPTPTITPTPTPIG